MKIPPKIEIAGTVYSIIFKEDDFLTRKSKTFQTGDIDFETSEITISTKPGTQYVDITFIHELLHGILLASGIQPHNDLIRHDEQFVEQQSHLWLQVFNQILDYNLKR